MVQPLDGLLVIALEQAVACVEHDMISRMAESQQTSGRDAATQ